MSEKPDSVNLVAHGTGETPASRLQPLDISIITPWLDHPEFIADYERAIAAPGVEAVIVDNGSSDANAALLKQMVERTGGRYLRNEENRWFAAANNQGMAAASGEVLVFLNNDIAADPAWLAQVRKDVQGGAIYGPTPRQAEVEGRTIAYLEGWCLAGQRATFERIHGWDADAFAMPYWEDADLCLRALAAGINLVQAAWPITHKKNGTSAGVAGVISGFGHNRKVFVSRLRGGAQLAPHVPGAATAASLQSPADFLRAGRLPDAERHFRALVERDPKDAQAWRRYGEALNLCGRYEAASDALRRAIELDPASAQAHHELASIHMHTRRFAQAAEAFENVVRLLPDNLMPRVNWADALCAAGQPQRAIQAVRSVLERDPMYAPANVALSHALRAISDLPGALEAAQRAGQTDPKSGRAFHAAAMALHALNRPGEASAALDRAMQLDPHNGAIRAGYMSIARGHPRN
jgi:Tfp pilus assembly protein PilF